MGKLSVEETTSIPLTATEVVEGSRSLSLGRQSRSREQQMRARVHYLGFRTTEAGREYTLRATSEASRLFVMLIGHQHFAAGQARFQDGPDLCCAKLTRMLAEEEGGEPALDASFVFTVEDLIEYRSSRAAPTDRKRRSRRTDADSGSYG